MLCESVRCLIPFDAHEEEVAEEGAEHAHHAVGWECAELNLCQGYDAQDHKLVTSEANQLQELCVTKIKATHEALLNQGLEQPAEEQLREGV